MELPTATAKERYAAVVAAGPGLVVGTDFDGTLAPIVADPEQAFIHPDAAGVLVELAGKICALAVITGRPAAQVLELGALEDIADRISEGRLVVLGQYGAQRWSSVDRELHSAEPPEELAEFRSRIPELLAEAAAEDAWIEEKDIAVALHTRRVADPQAAYRRLLPLVQRAAEELDLLVEPGRNVLEIRSHGTDKGAAVRELREELDAAALVFLGDDLGDVEAFKAVAELRDRGLPGLLVCSASEEENALAELADLVVDGPDGVLRFLQQLAADLATS